MFRMGVDSSPDEATALSPQDLILQRLAQLGVPEENLEHLQPGLVDYIKNNQSQKAELASAILPADEELLEAALEARGESMRITDGSSVEEILQESLLWMQWLMFEGEPSRKLEFLADMNSQRGVCGAVWGNNDIAYRCRTCELDPTCAICVPCFQNGNHKDHDYSIMYTGGGCCDCGDVTAWKREGFCSKHKGAEQIQPLPQEFANSMGPVLDSLLQWWKKKLVFAGSISVESPRTNEHVDELKMIVDELTSTLVNVLFQFCKCSESLLSFISSKVTTSDGLLDVLVRAERFLDDDVVKKLHELLLKLLGEPQFKYEFAKVLLSYYPTVVAEAIKESNDNVFKRYPLISTFSVQILTVPTLTPRLVKEMNLLDMLLECLGDIFVSCAGEDDRLQVTKWANLYDTTVRVIEDIRFVLSHSSVPKYVIRDRRDISRIWMRLLSFVQGMNPQKRETGIHVEEENEHINLPFVLGLYMSKIHSLFVDGAFSINNDEVDEKSFFNMSPQNFEEQDSIRHAKVGRLSQESSVSSTSGRSQSDSVTKSTDTKYDKLPLPCSVLWLTFECMRAIDNWWGVDNSVGPLLNLLSSRMSNRNGDNFDVLKRAVSRLRSGTSVFKYRAMSPNSKPSSFREVLGKQCSSSPHSGHNVSIALEHEQSLPQVSSVDASAEGEYATESEALHVLSLSDWPNISYRVSSEEISVHIPLHRFISMVLQQALRRCYGDAAPINVVREDFPPASTHEFFGYILGGCHPYGFSAFLMEHPLRIRVFCAEVHAGMWRKNGDAALYSCEWYRSVRWSEQGLEPDLFLLQCCAALAPADNFVKRILERFELANYLSLELERSSEYEPILVEEMLTLIIQIVKERRFSGLTTSECLQREFVFRLSIGDATRSQLVKCLPRDLSKSDKLQEVLEKIALYSNPSDMNQGMYKLRLSYWKELDLYHPRWSPRDLQVAEEKYLRFCNESALTTQLPKWSKIYPPLSGIARVATCKTTLELVRAVLLFALFTDGSGTSRAPDGVLLTALHLLSLALDICFVQRGTDDRSCYVGDVIPILAFADEEIPSDRYGNVSLLSLLVLLMRRQEKENSNNFTETGSFNLSYLIQGLLKKFGELEHVCLQKLQKLAPEVANQVLPSISSGDPNNTGSVSDSDKRKAKARERQAAIMEKMKAQQSKFLASIGSTMDDKEDGSEYGNDPVVSNLKHDSGVSTELICSLCRDHKSKSPVSYLILLQKSRLLSLVERKPPSWEHACLSGKERRITTSCTNIMTNGSEVVSSSQLTNLIQNALNEFSLVGQPREVHALLEYIKAQFPSVNNIQLPFVCTDTTEESTSSFDKLEEQMYCCIREVMPCVVSHSESLMSHDNKFSTTGGSMMGTNAESLLLGKYIAALSEETPDVPSPSESSRRVRSDSSRIFPAYDGFGPTECDGIYISSCGHAVHQGCLERYLSSLRERFTRRIIFEGAHIVDPDQGEFLCPVCRGLANSILPALPGDAKRLPQFSNVSPYDICGSLRSSERGVCSLQLQEALSLMQSAADVSGRSDILRSFSLRQFGRTTNLESVSGVLCGMYFPREEKVLRSGRVSIPLILWETLKYSLISTEIAARSQKSSLTPNYSTGALLKELKSSNGFILSLLLNLITSMRKRGGVTTLLRFRGIQLFASTICSGISLDKLPNDAGVQGGKMQYILEDAEAELQYPDIQLWRRASDPVLGRDAFSSLMWILFCLPSPFLTCQDTYLSLVHIFYAVTITQAIITFLRKSGCSMTELGCQDSLVSDIYKVIGECGVAEHYFDSNYIDPSLEIKDAVRSLSFPYLRRCALLWKLINYSAPVPFSNGAHISHGSLFESDDMMECDSDIFELAEVEKLEKMFKIPPLEVLLDDSLLRCLVLKWLRHFNNDVGVRYQECVLYSTPAVPFKLMILPHLYQDLLQRYIKQRCPDCRAVQEDPALCLICGKLCSPNWKACCRESGCQTHAMACCAGTGVFLLIRKTTILLQRSARQTPWASPYLDAFGEEDVEMHRGKPLYLNMERYAALTHMVVSHGIDRSSKVLRQTNIGPFLML